MENLNNGISIFSSDKFGKVRTILNADGTISISAEDAARGWDGFRLRMKNHM